MGNDPKSVFSFSSDEQCVGAEGQFSALLLRRLNRYSLPVQSGVKVYNCHEERTCHSYGYHGVIV